MDHFLPIYPLPIWKIKILKKRKNTWRYYHFTPVRHKSRSHVWFLRCGVHQTELFVILGHFFPFPPTPNNSIKQKIEKVKESIGDIIVLHTCTLKNNHMIYGSWDMEHNRNFFFFGHFRTVYPTNNVKNQNFEKMKITPRDVNILLNCTKHHDHMLYCSWDMACDGCNFHFSFWSIFCLFTPLRQRQFNFLLYSQLGELYWVSWLS